MCQNRHNMQISVLRKTVKRIRSNIFCSRWTIPSTHLNLFAVASHLDFIGFVIHHHILRASKIICIVTVIVLNMDTDVMFWNNFSDQYVGTVPLESVIFSVKGFVMRITPATAFTCCFRKHIEYFPSTMVVICLVRTIIIHIQNKNNTC